MDDDVAWKRTGAFKPLRLDTLRPGLVPFIGKTFDWDFAGTSDDDEPYPGQDRWMFARRHDVELGEEFAGMWVPQEDIVWSDGAGTP